MAGRPAVGRAGGLTGLHYGLIAFVILFVAALAGAIWLASMVGGERQRRVRAEQKSQQFGTPPSYYAQEANSRRSSVAAVMSTQLRSFASLVAGEAEAVWPAVEQAANQQLAATAKAHPGVVNPKDTLLTAVRKLDARLSEAQQTSAALLAELQDVQAQLQAAKQGLKTARDQFEAQVAALNEQVAQLQREKEAALAAKDAQLSELQAALESGTQESNRLKQEWVSQRREKEVQIGRLRTQVNELQKKLQELKGAALDPLAILTKADGRVLRAIPGSDIAYINLGANDNVKAGMSFEVFSPTHEPRQGLRGKASIQVATVMADTCECRVTRTTPGEPIVEGDICVNVAYERQRKPKFVVRGDFDLNYDGVVDFDGLERVSAIISEWGGQVVPELDETVDYMVVGTAPQVPRIEPGQPVSKVVAAQAEQRALARSRFNALIDRARSMYIPVITQNQFLFLTGYAGDSAALPR